MMGAQRRQRPRVGMNGAEGQISEGTKRTPSDLLALCGG